MRMQGWMRRVGMLGIVVGASLSTATGAEAQNPKGWVGINIFGADPVGEFGQLVDDGFGGQLEGRLALDRSGVTSLRIDAGFLVYGHERQTLCFPPPIGCRIGADLNTTNHIGYVGVGPEIAVPGAVSPYVFGTVGFSYFGTSSSLSGVDDWNDDGLFDTRHYSDFVTAGRVGGGLRVQVGSTGAGPVMLDFGAEYHRNGVAEYLRKGDILDHPDGSITLFPNRTEANLYLVRVGVSFGIGGGDRDDHDRDRDDRRRRGRKGGR